jgi:hypothetical protein
VAVALVAVPIAVPMTVVAMRTLRKMMCSTWMHWARHWARWIQL